MVRGVEGGLLEGPAAKPDPPGSGSGWVKTERTGATETETSSVLVESAAAFAFRRE